MFWSWAIIFAGFSAAYVFCYLTWHARMYAKPAAIVLGAIIVVICTYPAVMWTLQTLGWWTITPEYGRPALAMALMALLWLGILAYGQKPQ